jgi:stringent starvation protein B
VKELKACLVRSVCDWALDLGFTPHVAVDASYPGVAVPAEYVQDARIVLNIHPRAIQGYALDDGGLRFSARFGGRPFMISVPLPAILAVYARENGQGISFPEPEKPSPDSGPGAEGGPGEPPRKGPQLRVIK